jgi:hypothetical protein
MMLRSEGVRSAELDDCCVGLGNPNTPSDRIPVARERSQAKLPGITKIRLLRLAFSDWTKNIREVHNRYL